VTNHGAPHAGSELRRQHLTEIEAAYAADQGKRRLTIPKNTALDAAERIRLLVMSFLNGIRRTIQRSNKKGDSWSPSLDESKSMLACVTAYERAVATEERLRKMLKEEREGYTDEEHALALNRAIKMAAADWPAKDWWDALRVAWGDEVARTLVRLKWGEQVLAALEGS
jgi:hypothetical protein